MIYFLHFHMVFIEEHLKLGKTDNRETFLKKLIELNNEIKFNIFGINNKQPVWAENLNMNYYHLKWH
jgi:hypothetical protein